MRSAAAQRHTTLRCLSGSRRQASALRLALVAALLAPCALAVAAPSLDGPRTAPTPLASGSPLADFAPAFSTQFYALPVTSAFTAVTVALVPQFANPDIFARVGGLPDGPLAPLAQYSSAAAFGVDTFSIGRGDASVAAGCAANWAATPPAPCLVFIWVTAGPRATAYSLSATDGLNATTLTLGVPAIGSLSANATASVASASFVLPGAAVAGAGNVTFYLAPLGRSGPAAVPTLAVSVTGPGNASTYCATASTGSAAGLESIVLTPASPNGCWCAPANASSPPCSYFVDVNLRPAGPGVPAVQEFALTASTAAQPVTQLFDGVPTPGDGASTPGGTQRYFFNASFPDGARAVRVIQSPLNGSAQLYVTVDGTAPSPSNFQYSATRASGQNEVVVRPRDAAVVAACGAALAAGGACPLNIAVVTVTQLSSFTIVATLAAVTQLIAGSPLQDFVEAGTMNNYFLAPGVTIGSTEEFSLLPLSNAFVSLFVGSDAVPGTTIANASDPTTYCFTARTGPTAAAVITVPPTSPCFCVLTTCLYYVGVAASPDAPADYTVLGKILGGYLFLPLNTPVADVLAPSLATTTFNTYAAAYPEGLLAQPAASLTLNVDAAPGAGALTLYALVCVPGITCPPPVGIGPALAPPFAAATYVTSFDASQSNGQLVVSATDAAFLLGCGVLGPIFVGGECAVFYAVLADPSVVSATTIELTVFAGERQLVDGVVAEAAAATNAYTRFRFTVVDLTRPLQVSVVALSGNPDLFLQIGSAPNSTNFLFQSTTPGVESIVITWDSAVVSAAVAAAGGVPFDLRIAVLGYDGPAAFSIDATTNTIAALQAGVPTGGTAGPLGFAYYSFTLPPGASPSGFTVAVTPTVGPQPVILVNTPANARPDGIPFLPRCQFATCDGTGFVNAPISSFTSPSPALVLVDPTVPGFGGPGVYAVGVYAGEATTFIITATPVAGITQLVDGVPFAGFIAADNYTFFSVQAAGFFTSLTITMVQTDGPLSGPDLFASVNPAVRRPTAANCGPQAGTAPCPLGVPGIFASTSIGVRAIAELVLPFANATMPGGTPCNRAPCTVYFSLGETNPRFQGNISYQLVARTVGNTSAALLPVGVPVFGTLPSQGRSYYFGLVPVLPVNGTAGGVFDVAVLLSPVSSLNVDLFVTLDGSLPGPGNSAFNSTSASGVDYVAIPRAVIAAAANGSAVLRMNIAVVTYAHPTLNAAYFISWTDTDPNVVQRLLPNVPTNNIIAGLSSAYYYFSASALGRGNDVTVALTNNGGDADLFLSRWSDVGNNTAFRPGPAPPGANCANSTNDGADWIIIPAVGSGPTPPGSHPYASACRCVTYPCNYLITVACTTVAQCLFSITVRIGSAVPIRLAEGAPLTLPIAPGAREYFYFDTRASYAAQSNLTITSSRTTGVANVLIYATNTFIPGQTDPALLPNGANSPSYIWASPPPPSPTPTLSIDYNDAAFAACNATNGCPFIVFGVSADQATGVNTVATSWFSDGGVPQALPIDTTSPPQGVRAGVTRTFSLFLPRTSRDLIVFATVNAGRVGVSIDPTNAATRCVPGGGPAAPPACDGVWAAFTPAGGLGPTQLVIRARSPCANANAGGAPCGNATSWRVGTYFISVTGLTPATFTLTAGLLGTPVPLVDGVPVFAATSTNDPPLYSFNTGVRAGAAVLPVALYASSSGNRGALLAVNGCRAGTCTEATRLPTPSSAQGLFPLPANAGVVTTLSVGSPAYCTPLPGSFCRYYIAVYPAGGNCDPGQGCNAAFSLAASEQTGATPARIAFSSIANTVATTTGALPAGGNQLFEVYLDPASGPSSVAVVLESCGPGYPALFACNPDNAAACRAGRFAPSPGAGFTNAALPAGALGRASFAMPNVAGGAVFANMLLDADTPAGVAPRYALLIAARAGVFLAPGTTGGVTGGINIVNVVNATDVFISWPPAVVVSYAATGAPVVLGPAVGATYALALAVGGFNASQASPIVNSACGLDSWAATAGVGFLNTSTSTSALFVNLQSAGYYEVNVIAACDPACFAASLPPAAVEAMRAGMVGVVAGDGAGPRALQATAPGGALAQRAPYAFASFATAPNNMPFAPSAAGGIDLPTVIGGGVGGALALALLCAGGVVLARRGRAAPREKVSADARATRVAQLDKVGAAGAAASSTVVAVNPAAGVAAAGAGAGAAPRDRAAFEPVAPGVPADSSGVAGWK